MNYFSTQQQEPEQVRKLFLGGLSSDTSEEDIREYFGKYGEITNAVVIRDKVNKKSRGFGFVTFKTLASVDDVIEKGREKVTPDTKSGHQIRNRYVECKRAISIQVSRKLNFFCLRVPTMGDCNMVYNFIIVNLK